MKSFQRTDRILAWSVFVIAATVYSLTVEPSVSFWDCPEFILSAYKLETGHPPGAPFFMLMANVFSGFVSSPDQVARMVNILNALLSALCIMLLYFTITHLVRRLVLRDTDHSARRQVWVFAAGLVGSFVYMVSDTFWFSAVEAEVYACSSAFTALVVWLMLKWEDHADEPHSDRWLVLIAYMTGLSIGVHLLNLLCLPALVLVACYRLRPQAGVKLSLLAVMASFLLIALILFGLIPGVVGAAGWLELLFVNGLKCPYNTGLWVAAFAFFSLVGWGVWWTYRHGWRVLHTVTLCLLMLLIGYSSYAVVMIRACSNTPMNQNAPDNVFALASYLARDQYGERPLIYGQVYSSQPKLLVEDGYCRQEVKEGAAEYRRSPKQGDEADKYIVTGHKQHYVYAQNMLFPRMWSSRHADSYEAWMGGVEGRMEVYDRCGEMVTVKVPTAWENLRFFFSYQCNWMYWRYFMWNFCGRQNDVQGFGEPEHGNWLTGFSWIDNWLLGDQHLLPDSLRQNRGHNVYYGLPLLLGLLGMAWQLRRGRRGEQQFWVVAFLFLMTGLAIVVYLNQTPVEPRERDYSYAGSFYAFAIWCGMGVAALCQWASALLRRHRLLVSAIVGSASLLVPLQMGLQNWDDHDRSHRYVCRDAGYNYLMSLQDEGHPIVFSNGDNDTFPLWYCQEVEGVRTDARVCNLMYSTTDWYIDQLRRPAYLSPGVPFLWNRDEYISGTNDYVEVVPQLKGQLTDFYSQHPDAARQQFGDEPFELRNVIDRWVRSPSDGDMHCIPTDTLYITVDKEALARSGAKVPREGVPERMTIALGGRHALLRSELMILELLSRCNWQRPIYVCNSVGSNDYLNLDNHLVCEGLAERFVPWETHNDIDTERTYRNVMTRFRYTNIDRRGVYLDQTNLGMCWRYRRLFARLALALIDEGQKERALAVLRKSEKALPTYNVPRNIYGGDPDLARAFALLGHAGEATGIIEALWKEAYDMFSFHASQSERHASTEAMTTDIYQMKYLAELALGMDSALGTRLMKTLESCYERLKKL